MRFRIMVLADPTFGSSAGGVEVSQRRKSKSISLCVVVQCSFNDQLGKPIRITWGLLGLFGDWNFVGHAVSGTGTGEYDSLYIAGSHRFEQLKGRGHIVLIVLGRFAHGFSHQREGSKMHDCVDGIFLKYRFD